jgi:GNAT superfamily N-acetyltransferase
MTEEWTRGDYTISTDRDRLDLGVIHGFLSTSYWATGRSRDRVARSIDRSLAFGLYHGRDQVGFARVVTDYVVIAYLADVFILEAHRGKGLGRWLVDVVTNHSGLQSVRRWVLGTRDAHDLYRQFGFTDPRPNIWMERYNPESDRLP